MQYVHVSCTVASAPTTASINFCDNFETGNIGAETFFNSVSLKSIF